MRAFVDVLDHLARSSSNDFTCCVHRLRAWNDVLMSQASDWIFSNRSPLIKHIMFRTLIIVSALITHSANAQDPTAWLDSLDAYWAHLDAEYADSSTSPLKPEDRAHFQHLSHFPPDRAYCVEATFTPAKDTKPFTMNTSTARKPSFKTYGTLTFTLNGRSFTLPVYEDAVPNPHYPGYLFLPFTDLTNGEETYGAGRYIDLQAPLGPTVTLDFNRAYNPYCAYNDGYSCPIPPTANHLDIAVRAGVLKFHE